ncbi:MAG TPA: LPS assembly protein LptD [Thermoanaerobaculia bacterium]|nr:LPS assembly protein LptD [Thermoanaerobaculia bacterium]
MRLTRLGAGLAMLLATAPARPQASPPPDAAPPPAAEEPAAGRITFEIRMPAERGGGRATGSAGALAYESEDLAVASGGVELRYQDYEVRADRVTVNVATQDLVAEGGVVLDQGPRRLAGDRLEFNFETETGELTQATAYVNPDYYFSGAEIAKVGEDTYSVTDGMFTSCRGDSPPWSFRVSQAQIEVEGYARARNATMRVQQVPVFYLPYILWPVKQERTSGLLIPNVGYSRRRGSYIGLAYYQVIGRSYDNTWYADLYGKEYYGLGSEFRYHPSEDMEGQVQGYTIRDPLAEEDRWKVRFDHESNRLPGGLRGVISFRDYSDFEFFRDFERGLNEATLRTLYSSGFLTGTWGPQSLNLLVDDRQTFITADSIVLQRQLPEIEYRVRPLRLGRSPLYFQMLSSANYFSVDRSPAYQGEYGRADLFPQLSLPLRAAPWLSVSLNGGGRATWYGDSVCRFPTQPGEVADDLCGPEGQALTGETLTRVFPTAGAEIVGPSLSRIFGGAAGGKVKHLIEPRWTYTFFDEFDDRARVPLFDEVDTPDPANVGRVALVNRWLARPAEVVAEEEGEDEEAGEDDDEEEDEDDEGDEDAVEEITDAAAPSGARKPPTKPARPARAAAGAREVLLFELSQAYSFDSQRPLQRSADGLLTDPWSPVRARLRFNPSSLTNVQAEANYNTLLEGLDSTSLSGFVGLGRGNSMGATWFTRYRPETGDTLSDQIGLTSALNLGKRLRLNGQINWDLEQEMLQQQRLIVGYTGSCYSLRLELREFRAQDRRDRDYRFAVTLKNVGTFLDLTGGESEPLER